MIQIQIQWNPTWWLRVLNKELTEELVVVEKIDFNSITVEGSTASHVKTISNSIKIVNFLKTLFAKSLPLE